VAKTPKPGQKQTLKPTKKGQKPIKFTTGGLHASTGTPQGQPIPPGKMAQAASGALGPKAKAQAQFAKNVLTGPKKGSRKGKSK
jgi:hypothetical protein